MNAGRTAYVGADIFDGSGLHRDTALLVEEGRVAGIVPAAEAPGEYETVRLDGGTLAPGFVDLQVNGGGGVMFNDAPSVDTLRRIAGAHLRLGTTALLPTLITDTPGHTEAAIAAVAEAVADGEPGIVGLHLEGPHLSVARKGAHDPALIRPMQDRDLDRLIEAARVLPSLMVTVAPESVSPEQIHALSEAGAVVSLGHSDCSYDDALRAVEAGARCATHLFNAMSQLGNREPGLVGSALGLGGLGAGLIADGIHVHPETMKLALAAKRGPGEIFLVTDAMATAGSEITEFTLNGRRILRREGRLTLADGTLAGADLDLPQALRVLTGQAGVALPQALAMATAAPARVLGRFPELGALSVGPAADFVHLDADLRLAGVWSRGEPVAR